MISRLTPGIFSFCLHSLFFRSNNPDFMEKGKQGRKPNPRDLDGKEN